MMPNLNNFTPEKFTVQNPQKKLNHIFSEADCLALWAAYSAGRPLLVRGKPGTGKSQMAKAIADQLGWAFVSEVVNGGTELSDLHYHFDSIGRLAEAQASVKGGSKDKLHPLNYLSPSAIWWAYNWSTAEKQYERCITRNQAAPEKPSQDWDSKQSGVVLLIDEIDKAEPDLPNGLLETLGQYQFTVPYLGGCGEETTKINPITADASRLLIIITTNEERELPTAFVRRCFVHTLKMEDSTKEVDDDGLQHRYQWLMERGRLHFGSKISPEVYQKTAELLWLDRSDFSRDLYQPGLAEYIDLLNALHELKPQEQLTRLKKIASFALKKVATE